MEHYYSKYREKQRVVVIEDANASEEDKTINAIRWALHALSLNSGDQLILLSVLHHQCKITSLFSPKFRRSAADILGCKSRVGSSSIIAAKEERIIERKKKYENNLDLIQISKLCQLQEVGFKIEVVIGLASPKEVALISAQNLKPTWVVLDRQMKKEKKFFLQGLSCGISRMKHNKTIKLLRGPKIAEKHRTSVSYGEMIPGSPDEEDLFSIEL